MKVAQSCLTLCDPMDYTVHGILLARILEWVAFSLLQGIFPTQGSNRGLPHCRADSLLAEQLGKPKNTGVGNLSLLQWISPTQESNWGLLHCRQILYQLSYQHDSYYDGQKFSKGLLIVTVFKNLLAQRENRTS